MIIIIYSPNIKNSKQYWNYNNKCMIKNFLMANKTLALIFSLDLIQAALEIDLEFLQTTSSKFWPDLELSHKIQEMVEIEAGLGVAAFWWEYRSIAYFFQTLKTIRWILQFPMDLLT